MASSCYIRKFYKNFDLKTSPGSFCVQRIRHNLCLKMKFLKQATYISTSKSTRISSNQHADFLRFLFTEHSLKTKKVLELVFRPHFSYIFLMNFFLLQCYINWPNFITRLCLLPKLFSKMCFVFDSWAFDDTMTFEYLKS